MTPIIQVDEARLPEVAERGAREIGYGVRPTQACVAEEILGAVFGSITLWYLMSSVASLM